ncbi:MAG: response regulator [Verrucomicrobiota bacterium]
MNPAVLIIDDEIQVRRLLRVTLEGSGYRVLEASDGQSGLSEVAMQRPDVVLLDLGLPDSTGIAVLQRLREWSDVPVIILTVLDSDQDKVEALDAGADDYVTKPFSIPELLARIRVVQRRKQMSHGEPVYTTGALEVDFTTRIVRLAGKELHLSAIEYSLLRMFVQHPGRVLTHGQILREIWGPKASERREYLRVYITHLRKKIEEDATAPSLIKTEPGIGYRFMGE